MLFALAVAAKVIAEEDDVVAVNVPGSKTADEEVEVTATLSILILGLLPVVPIASANS